MLILCSLLVRNSAGRHAVLEWLLGVFGSLCAETSFCMRIKDDENLAKHKGDCVCLVYHCIVHICRQFSSAVGWISHRLCNRETIFSSISSKPKIERYGQQQSLKNGTQVFGPFEIFPNIKPLLFFLTVQSSLIPTSYKPILSSLFRLIISSALNVYFPFTKF